MDVFNRRGALEWGVYEYCPTELRQESLIVVNNRGQMDYGALLEAARMLEQLLGRERLLYLGKEDLGAAEWGLLDKQRREYRRLGAVAKGTQ